MTTPFRPFTDLAISRLFDEDQAPLEAAPQTRYPGPTPGVSAFMERIRGLMNLLPRTSGTVLDVTDPSVNAGDAELSQPDRILRNLRYLGKALEYSGTRSTVGGLPVGAGITHAIERGELAAPQTREERVAAFAAPILASMGLFVVGSAGAAAAGFETGAAAAGAAGLGRSIPATIGRGILGPRSAALATASEAGGGVALRGVPRLLGGGVKSVTPGAIEDMLGSLLFDTGLGAGFGAAEAVGAQRLDEGISNEEVLRLARDGAVFGLAVGALLRAPTIYRSGVSATRLLRRGDEGALINAGAEVADRVFDASIGRWRWKPGTKQAGRLATPPPIEDVRRAQMDFLSKSRQALQENPEGAAAIQAAQQSDSPLNDSLVGMIGAQYSQDVMPHRVRRLPKEALQAEARELQAIQFDAMAPEGERITAAGRLRALQHALGESPGTPAGQLPFEMDVAAFEVVRRVKPFFGMKEIEKVANAAAAQGMPEYARRILQIAQTEMPEGLHAAVLRRLKEPDRAASRGFRPGTRAIDADGNVVVIGTKPRYGWAYADNLTKGGRALVDVRDLTPLTKARTAELKDGSIVRILELNEIKRTVSVKNLVTGQTLSDVPLSELVSVGESKAVARQHELHIKAIREVLGLGENPAAVAARQRAQEAKPAARAGRPAPTTTAALTEAPRAPERPFEEGDLYSGARAQPFEEADVYADSPIPPVQAVTDMGEPVTIEAVGPSTATVRRSDGTTQVIAKSRVRRSSRAKPTGDERAIVDFSPGTIPEPGNRMLFTAVPKDQVDSFENAYLRREPIEPGTNVGLHILPPIAADPAYSLYAVELPSSLTPSAARTSNAKRALAALKSGGLTSYDSLYNIDPGVINEGILIRVPDATHAAAVRSESALKAMTPEAQVAYLRRLINLHETVDTGIAEAAARARASRVKAVKAIEANDAAGLVRAEEALADSHVAAIEAAASKEHRATERAFTGLDTEARSLDPQGELRVKFSLAGLTDETRPLWRASLAELQPAPAKSVPSEYMVLQHSVEPGQRLFVWRASEPAFDPATTTPGAKAHLVAGAVDENGHLIKETIRRFDSPIALENFIDESGYVASNTRTRVAHYTTPNGARSFRLTESATGRVEVLEAGGEAPKSVEIQAKSDIRTLLGIAEPVEDLSGLTIHEEVARPGFATREDALAFMKRYGAVKVADDDITNIPLQFSKLPPIEEVVGDKERLLFAHEATSDVMSNAIRFQGIIHPDIQDYALALGDEFERVFGKAPYTSELRAALGAPAVSDLGPGMISSNFGAGAEALLSDDATREIRRRAQEAGELISADVGNLDELLKVVSTKMHVGSSRPPVIPRHYNKFYGKMYGVRAPEVSKRVKAAQAAQRTLNQQTEWTPAYAKTVGSAAVEPSKLTEVNLGHYAPSGEVVEILDAPIEASEVRVRFPGSGSEMVVPKESVRPASTIVPGIDSAAKADLLTTGRYMDYAITDQPPLGLGEMERKLGMLGVRTPAALADAVYSRAAELAAGLKMNRTGAVSGSKAALQELMDMYGRAQWLNQVEVKVGGRELLSEEGAALLQRTVPATTRAPKTGFIPVEETAGAGGGVRSLLGLGEDAAPQPEVRFLKRTYTVTERALGQQQQVVKVTKKLDMESAVLQAIRDVDPRLEQPFKRASYERLRDRLGNHPYAELQAKAQSGMLTESQEALLRSWAKEIGISSNAPPAKIVSELAIRKAYDPRGAALMVQIKNDAGFIGWLRDTKAPSGTLTVKRRQSPYDLPGFMYGSSIPWKVARRHPLTRLVDDLIWSALEDEQHQLHGLKLFVQELQEHDITNSDLKVIRKAIQQHDTWEDAVKAGASDNGRLQYGFNRVKEWLEFKLDDIVRYFLRRRIEPTLITPELRGQLSPAIRDAVDDGVLVSSPNPDTWAKNAINPNGEVRRGLSEDQIERFIQLRRQHDSFATISAEDIAYFGNAMTPERFSQFFTFWKSYGIKNYWPLVHEGNMMILVTRGGKQQVLGWATNVADAIDVVYKLIDDGKLTVADGRLVDDVAIKQHSAIADDIIVRNTSGSEFRQAATELAKRVEYDADEMRGLIYTGRDIQRVKPPTQVHAKNRLANLEPPFVDPFRELSVYGARVARMNYRFKVGESHRVLMDPRLDIALSGRDGVPRLNEMTNLKTWMLDRISRALGEQGVIERRLDDMVAFGTMVREAPVALLKAKFKGTELPVNARQLLTTSYWHRKYAARTTAGEHVALQSVWRLGGSAGSAIANLSQYLTTTIPALVKAGTLSQEQASKIAFGSWLDGMKLAREYTLGNRGVLGRTIPSPKMTPEMRELMQVIDDVGAKLMPGKHEAGGVGISFADAGSYPLRLGRGNLKYGLELANYYAMLMFQGAENTNRFSTAIAGYRLARARGMNYGEAVAFAKNMVRETQFLYDELAIPSLLGDVAGPASRVLFQFKPFLINMLSFEKDLILGVMRKEKNAIPALLTHVGALTALGGAVGLAHHPLSAAISGVAGLGKRAFGEDGVWSWIHDHTDAESIARRRRAERNEWASPEERMSNTMNYRWDDVLFYGLPGLLHLSLGQRVGLSGQDFERLTTSPSLLGPQGSLYYDMFQVWKAYLNSKGSGAGVAGGLVGGAVLPSVAAALPGAAGAVGKAFFSLPLTRSLAAGTGAMLTSWNSDNSFSDFLANSREGRVLFRQGYPTMVRNFEKTAELHDDGAIRDIDGKPMTVPIANRTEEMLYLLTGLPTIRQQEYAAMVGLYTGRATEIQNTREVFLNRAAEAWINDDKAEAYEAIIQARRLGVDIDESALQRRVDAITQERLESVRMRAPVGERNPQ